jgi:hypothetical protein
VKFQVYQAGQVDAACLVANIVPLTLGSLTICSFRYLQTGGFDALNIVMRNQECVVLQEI